MTRIGSLISELSDYVHEINFWYIPGHASSAGNVYAGCGDGVRVYNPAGKFLGVFAVEGGVANLVFGGEDGRTLVMLNETRAIAITMAVTGALS